MKPLIAIAIFLLHGAAHSALIEVDTLLDTQAPMTSCSLRSAILAANSNQAQRGCPAGQSSERDRIRFDPSLWFIGNTITLNLDFPLPVIVEAVEIVAPGTPIPGGLVLNPRYVNLRPDGDFRILTVLGGVDDPGVLLVRLNFIDGNGEFSTGVVDGATGGGGVFMEEGAVVAIMDSRFEGNAANGSVGGAIAVRPQGATAAADGQLTLTNVRFINNSADRHGAIAVLSRTASTPVTILNGTFEANTSVMGAGAIGLESESVSGKTLGAVPFVALNVQSSTFTQNSGARGGAIAIQTTDESIIATATDVVFDSNAATQRGGALDVQSTSSASPELRISLIKTTLVDNQAPVARAMDIGLEQSNGDSVVQIEDSLISQSAEPTASADVLLRPGAVPAVVRESSFVGASVDAEGDDVRAVNNFFYGAGRAQRFSGLRLDVYASSFVDNTGTGDARQLIFDPLGDVSAFFNARLFAALVYSSTPESTVPDCRIDNVGEQGAQARYMVANQPSCEVGLDATLAADLALETVMTTDPRHALIVRPTPASPAIDAWPQAACNDINSTSLGFDLLGNSRPTTTISGKQSREKGTALACDAGAVEARDAGAMLEFTLIVDGDFEPSSSPGILECNDVCTATSSVGDMRTISIPSPDVIPGSTITWSTPCEGSDLTCTVDVYGDMAITISVVPPEEIFADGFETP